MNPITPPREFLARRLADERCRKEGAHAQRSGASRLAARLYKAGSSVDAAAREAFRTVARAPTTGGAA
jgi:hypothetical protein